MPHGIVGLLIAVILCATMSATAATLNALGSTTAIDFYRPLIRPNASDHHYVVAAQALTAAWGLIAIGVASFASLVENLLEAGNILGSVFYGSILGLFLAAFFIRRVTGSAVFFAALLAQTLVFVLFATTNIGYLWYNFIGCAAVLILAPILQQTVFRSAEAPPGHEARFEAWITRLFVSASNRADFFPSDILVAKILTARRLQKEIGGEIVFFFHDSDHDPRETITILRDQHSNRDVALNFQFENRIQKQFSPLYAKRVPPDWQEKTARQLPRYVRRASGCAFQRYQSFKCRRFLSRDVQAHGIAGRCAGGTIKRTRV